MRTANQVMAKIMLATSLLVLTPALMALEKVTLPFWEIVACSSEDVEIEGSVRFQTHYVEGADHATWVFQAFWSGRGLGLESGASYKLMGKWMEVVQENPPFIFLWNDHFQLIGKGSAANYSFSNKVKFVVNANGDVVVDTDSFEWPCETIDASTG
jgi:hypothetical protein